MSIHITTRSEAIDILKNAGRDLKKGSTKLGNYISSTFAKMRENLGKTLSSVPKCANSVFRLPNGICSNRDNRGLKNEVSGTDKLPQEWRNARRIVNSSAIEKRATEQKDKDNTCVGLNAPIRNGENTKANAHFQRGKALPNLNRYTPETNGAINRDLYSKILPTFDEVGWMSVEEKNDLEFQMVSNSRVHNEALDKESEKGRALQRKIKQQLRECTDTTSHDVRLQAWPGTGDEE